MCMCGKGWRGAVAAGVYVGWTGKCPIRALFQRQWGVFPGSSLTYRAFTCCSRHKIRYSHALFLLTSFHAAMPIIPFPFSCVYHDCTRWTSLSLTPPNRLLQRGARKKMFSIALCSYVMIFFTSFQIMPHNQIPVTVRVSSLSCFYITPVDDPQVWNHH